MDNLQYSVGVDIAKDKFDCCFSQSNSQRIISIKSTKAFSNCPKGFEAFLSWINTHKSQGASTVVVMEATGVYYESLAYFLHKNSELDISVLLPNKVKYYFKSLNVKTKTDKVDAQMLSQLGLERRLNNWKPISYKLRTIKQLSREYRNLKSTLNKLKNQRHALEHSFEPNAMSLRLLNQRITLAENQCLELTVALKNIVFEDVFLQSKVENICTIPGIGFMTAITIIAETNGFNLIRNAKQLCSYAGLDVRHNQSGTKSGRSRISKKGNRYMRQAMYMPALTASKKISHLSQFYQRINDKNKCKKIGLIAVSRKLLILIYILWKNDEVFIPR